jgi:4-carboxymuconolactone decarboxylase
MDKERFERGAALRRQVVGDEYVNGVDGYSDAFNAPIQDYFTEIIWGGIWAREGLPLKTRSLVVIAILITAGRLHLLGVQFKAAIRNGCTLEEIREVIIQCAGFSGGPAAVDAMRVANEVLVNEIAALGTSGA